MKKILCFLVLLGGILFFNMNVNAYTIFQNDIKVINEQYIYNKFSSLEGFDIELYPHIVCKTDSSIILTCRAYNDEAINSMYLTGKEYSGGRYEVDFNGGKSCHFTINNYRTSDSFNGTQKCGDDAFSSFYDINVNSQYMTYSNFDLPVFSTSDNSKINVLDFKKYLPQLKFNDNLFANDENFKKVCVNKNSSFSITKKTTDGVISESDHDFIWFPHGISGIKQFNYSTDMSNGYYEFVDPYENFYFSSYDSINSIWNTEYMANNFESKGYTDKYKYYGYTAYLFLHWYNFNDGQTYNFFPIFELTDNVTTSHISSSGNTHGGGGTRLDGDEEIELSDEYCFYIKNEYEVNEVILDEWGDHYTSVNTPNGPTNYGTTVNKDNANSKSFLLQPLEFISQMSGTIAFINTHIYNFYMAMPLIVRTFIVTALIILIVVLIMKIGGYK